MSTFEFLVELKNKGIDIALNGDRLKLNAPKGTMTADLKQELTNRKAEIIEFLQRAEQIGDQAEISKIEPIDRSGVLPLSPAQERVWSLYQLDPHSTVLNVPVVWRLEGALDLSALQNALRQLIDRHETLRTIFKTVDGKPQAHILPEWDVELPLVQLKELPEPEREALRLIEAEGSKRPFSLTTTPAHRATLYEIDDSHHFLLINCHQIIFDWGAFDILQEELMQLYNAYLHKRPLQLPPLHFQYVDFAHWQQTRLQGARLDELQNYWQTKLAQPTHLLQLPISQNPDQTDAGTLKFSLDEHQTDALKQLSRQNGTTLFTVLLALYNVLLSSYAPEDDVLVFTTTGQERQELKQLIGLFANVALLRTDLSGNPAFKTIVERVKETTLGTLGHHELPIEQVLKHLHWSANSQHNNIFQTAFIFQQSYPASEQFAGLEAELLSVGEHLAGFEWRFFLEEVDGEIYGEFEFDNTRYGASTIQAQIDQFLQIVQRVLADSTQPLDALRVKTAVSPQTVQTTYTAPSDDIEKTLVRLWQEALTVEKIGVTDNFFALGGHSLMAAELFHRIKQELDANLPLALLIDAPTIQQLASHIRTDDHKRPWRSLVPIQTEGTAVPLFLIHGAGGNVLLYRDLAKHLGNDQPVYGLQAQGLDGQGNYFTDFESMAAFYIDEIKTVQPVGPYNLGGYCLGGALAYEMAQQLTQAGDTVNLVAMFESFQIHANPVVFSGKYDLLYKLQNLWFHADNLLRLPLKDMVAFFKEKATVQIQRFKQKRASKTQSDDALIHVILDDINDAAHEAYVPVGFNGRVAVFRPHKDFIGMDDPTYGWGDLVPNSLIVRTLKVNPKGMMVEPYVQQLAGLLGELL